MYISSSFICIGLTFSKHIHTKTQEKIILSQKGQVMQEPYPSQSKQGEDSLKCFLINIYI